ncbi:cyclic pyranopterin monophosphate synthase MoaC [soil metagenome]
MVDPSLTHLDAAGSPRMVDVADKPVTTRVAVAEGALRMKPETLAAISAGDTPKGNVLVIAQIAGITAAKRTADLIPLCHPLPLTSVAVALDADPHLPGVRARATARVEGKTGVEMEALTAVSIALLTVYDMCKAIDREMTMDAVRLVSKQGGRGGSWNAGEGRE